MTEHAAPPAGNPAARPPARRGHGGLTALIVGASFFGVAMIKQLDSPAGRHGALMVWFLFLTIVMEWKRGSRPRVSGTTEVLSRVSGSDSESRQSPTLVFPAPAAELKENNAGVPWWGIPRSTFGVALATLHAAATVLVFTLSNAWNQWQHNFTINTIDLLSLEQLVVQSMIVPVYEEAFFRGMLLSRMLPGRAFRGTPLFASGVLRAVYLNALVFWLFHLPPDTRVLWSHLSSGSVPLSPGPFFLGFACAFVAARDRSIWGAVLLHGIANAAGPFWAPALEGTGLFPYFFSY